MKKTLSLCLLCFFLLSLVSFPIMAQDASDILKKMIEAMGGRNLIESIKDTTLLGSLEIIQVGMTGTLTMYQKEPNKMRWDAEMMGTMVTMAFDGETAWWTNPQTGNTEEMSEQQAEYFKRGAMGNDSLLNPAKYGISYAYKGKEKINEKEYFVLEQTYSDGFKATLYIDPETYLTYKSKSKTLDQSGTEVESESISSDYKKVDGVMVAHSITIFQAGQEFMKMTFTSVKFNAGLEDSFFKK